MSDETSYKQPRTLNSTKWINACLRACQHIPTAQLEAAPPGSVKALVEALEKIELLSTNHGGQFDQPGQQFKEYTNLGRIARAALSHFTGGSDNGEG